MFCILPWISLHVTTAGDVLPCCVSDSDDPLGSARDERLGAVWNGAAMRALRLRMLAGEASAACTKCYEVERSAGLSLRRHVNTTFAHHLPRRHRTAPDGALPTFEIAYLDVRSSNVCNMACVTCGPAFSTAWYRYDDTSATRRPVRRPFASPDALRAELLPLLDTVEHVYFAGGEPALAVEHYWVIEQLIALRRTDVHLSYSTNLSTLSFGHWDLLRLWQHFPSVSVGASLDACGLRAEYLRFGVPWDRIVANRRHQLTECPHVQFCVTATLGNLNALHFPDFHESWQAEGLLHAGAVFLNILLAPGAFRLTTLPSAIKQRVRDRYDRHLDFLRSLPGTANAIACYETALRFMGGDDTTTELGALRERLTTQDARRGTSFAATFPELRDLLTG